MRLVLLAATMVVPSLVAACSCSGARPPAAPARPPVAGPSYEVHEWGLVRGTADDHVMVSGPHAEPVAMAVAKPVLYFHRAGQGALLVDVEARVAGGRIVEAWPSMGGQAGEVARWPHVLVQAGACHGSRYPGLGEDPCSRLADGCESATLATVETTDDDCLSWPEPPGGDGPTETWNHLFYRGEASGTRSLPLRVEPLSGGTLRVTSTTTESIPGHLVRVRRANGVAGATDAVEVAAPPAPGASTVVSAPHASIATGADALASSLGDAGLTPAEVAAFGRAWDEALFGATGAPAATADLPIGVAAASPLAPPRVTTSLLYLLPPHAVDVLAPLHFDPAPTAVRRGMVVWVDEAAASAPSPGTTSRP